MAVATSYTTVVTFRRNACTLKVTALAVLNGWFTNLNTYGIQHRWKIITTNALKTTSKGDLVISTVGMSIQLQILDPFHSKKVPIFTRPPPSQRLQRPPHQRRAHQPPETQLHQARPPSPLLPQLQPWW